jgi:hypothetical protein
MPTTCEILQRNCTTTTEDERALLLRAFREWSNHSDFTNADVCAVKAIFHRIFSDPTALVGSTYQDALVMQPRENHALYYAMIVSDDTEELQWKRAHTTNDGVFQAVGRRLSFDQFIAMVGYYDR